MMDIRDIPALPCRFPSNASGAYGSRSPRKIFEISSLQKPAASALNEMTAAIQKQAVAAILNHLARAARELGLWFSGSYADSSLLFGDIITFQSCPPRIAILAKITLHECNPLENSVAFRLDGILGRRLLPALRALHKSRLSQTQATLYRSVGYSVHKIWPK